MKKKGTILAAVLMACTLCLIGCGNESTEQDTSAVVEEIKITNEENVPSSYDLSLIHI